MSTNDSTTQSQSQSSYQVKSPNNSGATLKNDSETSVTIKTSPTGSTNFANASLDQPIAQTNENRFELVRNWNLLSDRELLTVTNYIDAKDTVNNWCVGQVIEEYVDQGMIKVHFEGWSERHDVVIKKNSNKIALFRSQTQGYTGQRRSAFRDFKLNQAQQIIIEKKVQHILESKFTCFASAHEITQFIRGELYFHLDSLFTLEHALQSADLPAISEFIKLVFELILTWMEVFPNYQDAFRENRMNHLLFCVDIQAAISQCCFELVEVLGKVWGQHARAKNMFTQFKGEYIREGPYARADKIQENGWAMTLTNLFGEVNGFQRIIQVIKGSEQSVFPLPLAGIVLSQFTELPHFCEKQQTDLFASEITQTLMHRLDNLTDLEIKDMDRGTTRCVLDVLESFIKIYQPQSNMYEISETYELRIAHQLLMSPFFEKKIRGMAEFKDIFNKVENRQRFANDELRQNDIAAMRFLNFQNFSSWIVQTQILEYIYIENPHCELIKRSLELIYLRASDKENPLGDQVIEAIWKCATEKHEDIMRATLVTIEQLIKFLQPEQLAKFYFHLKKLPDSEYDDMRVDFLKKYTEGAIDALYKHRNALMQTANVKPQNNQAQSTTSTIKNFFGGKNKTTAKDPMNQIDASKYLDLNKFWEISQESNDTVTYSTRQRALNALIEILKKYQHEKCFPNQMSKIDFMNLALENIAGGRSMYTSINFLQSLILTYPRDNANGARNYSQQYQGNRQPEAQVDTRERIVQQLIDQDIFTKLIGNAAKYQLRVASSQVTDAQVEEAKGKENLSLFGDGDNISHKSYIDCFMGFIEFIITNSKNGNLQFSNIVALFKALVSQSVCDYEQNIFFNFLTKENTMAVSRERKFLLDERRRTDVFRKIMCNQDELDCTRLGIEGFRCFKMLFLNVNAEHRHINHNTKTGSFEVINIMHFQELIGIDTLWSITIQSSNLSVANESRNFLVDIFLKSQIDAKHRKVFAESFLKHVEGISVKLDSLKQDKNSMYVDMRLNWITLIRTYVQRFDYMHIQIEDIKKYDERQNVQIQVTLDPEKITHDIIVNPKQQIWQIVVQVAHVFNLRVSEFQIVTKKGPLDASIYFDAVSAYTIKQLQIMRVDEAKLNNENPRRIIGQDKLFLKQLHQLLVQLVDHEKVSREIIALLDELPVNLEMQAAFNQAIMRIPCVPNDPESNIQIWAQLFDWEPLANSSFIQPSTFHNIMLLHECILASSTGWRKKSFKQGQAAQLKNNTTEEFILNFTQRGGFKFLSTFFNSIGKNGLETSTLKNKALTMLIELMSTFLSNKWINYLKESMTQQNVFDVFTQCLQVAHNFIVAVERQQREQMPHERALKNDQHLINITLQLIQKFLFIYPKLMRVFSEFPSMEQLIQIVFLKLETERIQQKVAQCFLDICKKLDQELIRELTMTDGVTPNAVDEILEIKVPDDVIAQMPSVFFLRLFWTQYLHQALQFQKETAVTKELFMFFTRLMQETDLSNYLHVIFDTSDFISQLTKMIKQRPILEDGSGNNEDVVLSGIFNLLKATLRKRTDIRATFPEKESMLHYLLHQGLFHKETNRQLISKDVNMPPKCKSKNSRYACLSLVKELTIENQVGLRTLVDYMRETIYSSNVSLFWRSARASDWSITTNDKQEKSTTGYVGLKNIGCICYMNSIMQQLFMITPFRKAMLEVEDQQSVTETETTNVLYQIKRIFGALQEVEKQYFNPKKFCFAFKDIDGQPIDPMVQRDVDEFFNMLIDRIENLIKGTKEEKVMKNLFYGVFANEFICKGCPHYSEREEQFMAIPLQVKNKKSILEGLETFVEGEMLEGDNAYYCEKCECKRDTLKRCAIKRLPNVLFLELKRFEFNFDTMQKYKINDYCSFPMELDMKPYSQEHISRQDLIKLMNDKNLTMEDLNSDQTHLMNNTVTDQYYQYSLKGAVVHNGTSEQGHYYSFVKDREASKDAESNWYEFNDTQVQHFDSKQIPEECFGGENDNYEANMKQYANDPAMQQLMQNSNRNKTKNAYILIYERLSFIDQERFNEYTDDQKIVLQDRNSLSQFNACRLPITVDSQIQITPTIHEKILEKNRRFWLTRFIFNRQFLDQSLEIFRGFQFQTDTDYHGARQTNLQLLKESGVVVREDQFEILKYIITFTLTVAFRASIRTQIPSLVRIIRKALQNNIRLSIWFCEIFSSQQIIKEFFLDCTITDMSRFTAGLLYTAMANVFKYEKEIIMEYTDKLDQQSDISDYIAGLPGDNLVSKLERRTAFASKQGSQSSNQTPGGTPGQTTSQINSAAVNTDNDTLAYSCCDRVQVLQCHSGYHQNMPSLIAMINAFLHFQTSSVMIQQVSFTAHLHAVVAHFASLGPIARHYLLKSRTLARLLRILLTHNNSAPNLPNTPINEAQFMYQMMPLIEVVRIRTDERGGYLSPNPNNNGSDNKASQKERQQLAVNMQSPMIFIIKTIQLLVRSCQFVTVAANQLDPNDLYNGMFDAATGERQGFSLDKGELDLLINNFNNRVWWRSSAQEFPFCRNDVARIFAHISTNNSEFSHVYIQEVFKVLAVNNFMVIRRYERPLLALVEINDQYQRERITKILNNLYEVLRKNTMYWKQCDQLIELTLKLCNRCRMFAVEMSKSKNLLTMIATITRENPSFPYNQGRVKIFRDGVINLQHINKEKKLVNQGKVDSISNYSKQRLEQLNRVVEMAQQMGEVGAQEHQTQTQAGDDSDDDCYEMEFETGTHVDVYFERGMQGWFPAKVIVCLQEMVKVQAVFQNNQKQECWVELESTKIARIGTYTKNEKTTNYQYFQELYKLIEPSSSSAQASYNNDRRH